jgi:hypothetical protein
MSQEERSIFWEVIVSDILSKKKKGGPVSLNSSKIVIKEEILLKKTLKTPWPEYTSELYRPSGRRLSAKLVPTFADRRCYVVRMTDPYGRVLGFLDQRYYLTFLIPAFIVHMKNLVQFTQCNTFHCHHQRTLQFI